MNDDDKYFDPSDLECDFTAKDYAWACAEVRRLNAALQDMEEKCQFWCDEARKLGYKE